MSNSDRETLKKFLSLSPTEWKIVYNLSCSTEGRKPTDEDREEMVNMFEEKGWGKRREDGGIEMTEKGLDDFFNWIGKTKKN